MFLECDLVTGQLPFVMSQREQMVLPFSDSSITMLKANEKHELLAGGSEQRAKCAVAPCLVSVCVDSLCSQ